MPYRSKRRARAGGAHASQPSVIASRSARAETFGSWIRTAESPRAVRRPSGPRRRESPWSYRSSMADSDSPDPSPSPAGMHDLPATGQERRASGKGARKRVTRGTLGHWAEENRGHDAAATILAQNQIRVSGLVPIRHHRMAVSPWNYYRGAAAVMAGDLASQPHSGLMVQL